jgi:hypothetical protein
MIYVLAIVLAGLMAMVLISLLRGLNAFRANMGEEQGEGTAEGTGATELQLMQNRMMFARIKYQAAAVIIVMLMLAIAN